MLHIKLVSFRNYITMLYNQWKIKPQRSSKDVKKLKCYFVNILRKFHIKMSIVSKQGFNYFKIKQTLNMKQSVQINHQTTLYYFMYRFTCATLREHISGYDSVCQLPAALSRGWIFRFQTEKLRFYSLFVSYLSYCNTIFKIKYYAQFLTFIFFSLNMFSLYEYLDLSTIFLQSQKKKSSRSTHLKQKHNWKEKIRYCGVSILVPCVFKTCTKPFD